MTRTAGARIGCQRPSRFWGLGCPKIYHEVEDTLVHFLIKRKTSELNDKARHLEHLANHDPLTSLPNRKLFFDRLRQSLKRAEREETLIAVLYLDLDQFKQINDSYPASLTNPLVPAFLGAGTWPR